MYQTIFCKNNITKNIDDFHLIKLLQNIHFVLKFVEPYSKIICEFQRIRIKHSMSMLKGRGWGRLWLQPHSNSTVVAGGTTREALSHLLGFLTSTRHKSHLDNQISVRDGLLLLAVTCQHQSTFQNLYLLFSPTFSSYSKNQEVMELFTLPICKKGKKTSITLTSASGRNRMLGRWLISLGIFPLF